MASGYYWVDDSLVPSVSTDGKSYSAYYNADSYNYHNKDVSVIIKVLSKLQLKEADIPNTSITQDFDPEKKVSDYLNDLPNSGAGFSFASTVTDAQKNTILNAREAAHTFAVIYNPDSTNYDDYTTEISITINKASRNAGDLKYTIENAGEYVRGNTLANYTLPEGYTWTDSSLTASRTSIKDDEYPVFTAIWNKGSEYDSNYNECTGVEITLKISKAVVTIDSLVYVDYTGDQIKAIPNVYYNGSVIEDTSSYTLSYGNTTNLFSQGGTYSMTVSLKSDNFMLATEAVTVTVKVRSVALSTDTKTLLEIEDALSSTTSGTIVVMYNTILNNSATVKSGVTLLVPYSNNYSYISTINTAKNGVSTGSAHRTLTIANDKSLTVSKSGILNVSGIQSSGQPHSGYTSGDYGQISMETNSYIYVHGELYSFGYIKGTGTVIAYAGAEVYELLDIEDWPGGTAALKLVNDVWNLVGPKTFKSFPFSQFRVANIETVLSINSGASLYAHYYITGTGFEANDSVTFMGAGGLFTIEDGYIIKSVDNNGKIKIESHGNITTNNITLKISIYTVTSKGVEIPICEYYNIIVAEGNVTVNSKLKIMSGASLTIEEGAAVTIANSEYAGIVYST